MAAAAPTKRATFLRLPKPICYSPSQIFHATNLTCEGPLGPSRLKKGIPSWEVMIIGETVATASQLA